MAIHYYSQFGTLYDEKSGNPADDAARGWIDFEVRRSKLKLLWRDYVADGCGRRQTVAIQHLKDIHGFFQIPEL
jgi:hypothetical protein